MLPAVLNLIKQIRDLSSLVKVFISKYEKEMKTAGMESDFKQLVKEFDDVLEALAKILELFRMKSLANSLRDLEK
jgi:hypothetical protein